MAEPTPAATPRHERTADRITTAAVRCIARWGVAKTTLDDIAAEAECSRATIYRVFPGGKSSVLLAAGEAEVRRFLDDLSRQLDQTTSLEELLVVTMVTSVRAVRAHEALQYLLVHEPGQVLAHAAFDALDPLLALAREYGGPYLEPYLGAEAAGAGAEWIARLIVGYAIGPHPVDLANRDVATHCMTTFVLPGLAPPLLAGTT
jgi:AcrR family transcriptional regulator